jgi:hypothetical protein
MACKAAPELRKCSIHDLVLAGSDKDRGTQDAFFKQLKGVSALSRRTPENSRFLEVSFGYHKSHRKM